MSDRHFWYCNACGAQNSREDGECQFCECKGSACERDSCSDPRHFPIRRFRLFLARPYIFQDAGAPWVAGRSVVIKAVEAADALAEAYRMCPTLEADDVRGVEDLGPEDTQGVCVT